MGSTERFGSQTRNSRWEMRRPGSKQGSTHIFGRLPVENWREGWREQNMGIAPNSSVGGVVPLNQRDTSNASCQQQGTRRHCF